MMKKEIKKFKKDSLVDVLVSGKFLSGIVTNERNDERRILYDDEKGPEWVDIKILRSKKTTTIFDLIEWLTIHKKRWENLSEKDKKLFNPYIINRFLSMDLRFCEAINDMQQYTTSMDKDKAWRLFYEVLPEIKLFLKYIKPKELPEISERQINIFKQYFSVNEEHAIEYFITLNRTEIGKDKIKKIILNYINDKEI